MMRDNEAHWKLDALREQLSAILVEIPKAIEVTHRATTVEQVSVSVNYPDCQHVAPVLRVVRTGGRLDILVEGRATTATPGYKLVPIELTKEMHNAARLAWCMTPSFNVEAIYKAILATTPDTATTVADQQSERCTTCDSTGDVHRADGEWMGECTCAAGVHTALERLKIAAEKTMRENEELRAALAQQGAAQVQAGDVDGDRWRFMMAVADDEDGPESLAMNKFRRSRDDDNDQRPESVQMAEIVDKARAAMAAPATSGGGNGSF